MKSGVIIINKETGISSQAAVNRVKRLLGESKAGHTGTLDPLATGVLPVLLGRGVKASEYMLSSDKHYIATLRLGITTDTEDITGTVLTESDAIPSEEAVKRAAYELLGESMQTPPMFSALKVGGKKLYDLARAGVTVEREPRKITVKYIEAQKIDEKNYRLEVKCSKGTYIRTLCNDIGKKLGCGAVMATLERASASTFSLEDSITLTALEQLSPEQRDERIIPIDKIFERDPQITLSDFYSRLARCGVEIYLSKIKIDLELGKRVRLYDKKGFFALGEVREFDTGLAIKPIKQFDV